MDGVARIATEGLAIGYGGKAVASGIDLSVGPSEILCLLGPNGSGKTTLFRTLLGLIPPVEGRVLVEGKPLAGLSRRETAEAIAYVPQAQVSAFSFTVMDLVLMGRTAHLGLFDQPGRADRIRAMEALSSLGIAHLAERDATRISGGQRQLALIARALAQDARTIVMDEPTASLDFGNRLRVLDHIKRLAADGLAIVLSTHEPEHALAVADRVAVIAEGKLAGYGTPGEIVTAETLSAAYGVAVTTETTPSGRRVVLPAEGRMG